MRHGAPGQPLPDFRHVAAEPGEDVGLDRFDQIEAQISAPPGRDRARRKRASSRPKLTTTVEKRKAHDISCCMNSMFFQHNHDVAVTTTHDDL